MYRAVITAAACLAALAGVSRAQSHVEVGVLTCTAQPPASFIDGSTRDIRCHFVGRDRDRWYRGTIRRLGRDIGAARQARIAWAVLAPTADPWSRFLVGTYTAAATRDGRANVLVGGGATHLGGPTGAVVLQPLGAGLGTDVAAAVASLGLRTMRRPRRRG